MKNLKVSSKLIVSFMIVVALMLVLAVFAIIQMYTIQDNFTIAIDNPLTVRASMREFQVNFREARIAMQSTVTFTGIDPAHCEELHQNGIVAYEASLVSLQSAEEAITSNPKMTAEEKAPRVAKVDEIRNLAAQYRAMVIDPMQAAMRSNEQSQALAVVNSAADAIEAIKQSTTQMLQTADTTSDEYVAASNQASNFAVTLMIIIAFVAAVIAVILALYISRLVSKPLSALTAFMMKASGTGDITLSAEDQAVIGAMAKVKDEIGQSIGASAAFIQNMIEISKALESIADGDLTVTPKVLSNNDVMGVSLKKMLDNLNNMFGEIHNSTAQVSTGAKQIADGSQALAQGSTEQAASVEQLSSSISEIADKTKENAAMADKAATLANTIKQNAEKGSAQMDELTGAVREINTASQNISKVIKSIEDIAFQTNILALNASVEAARAGQHGKGFAVVAEEVRNLATKSSVAAQDTGALIANSVEKAELGARIADETASSLTEIVAGINESSLIVTEIAKSSEEQSLGIAQINRGIDQVAQVVQQNSATAEESAAASEEMSGQSIMLEELIAQFKLRDAGTHRLSSGGGTKKQITMPEKTAYAPNGGDFGKY